MRVVGMKNRPASGQLAEHCRYDPGVERRLPYGGSNPYSRSLEPGRQLGTRPGNDHLLHTQAVQRLSQ